jgi:hypothetical protein
VINPPSTARLHGCLAIRRALCAWLRFRESCAWKNEGPPPFAMFSAVFGIPRKAAFGRRVCLILRHYPIESVTWTCSSHGPRNVRDTLKQRFPMPAKTDAVTGFDACCLAAADHFIACHGSKPATRIRAHWQARAAARVQRRRDPDQPLDQGAVRDGAQAAPDRARLQPSGRRGPGACCGPDRLHRAGPTHHSGQGTSPSGDRGTLALTRSVQPSRPAPIHSARPTAVQAIGMRATD